MSSDLLPDDQVDAALRGRLFDVLTALPGRVVSYNRQAGTVDVQPVPATLQGGEPVAWPILRAVPIAWPRAGASAITWPISAGDYVQLQFHARSIEQFLAEGDEGDPQSPRTHHLSDAVAMPGVWPTDGRLSPAPADDALELREPTGGFIRLGQGASHAAVLGDTFVSAMSSLLTALAAHTHVTAVGPTMPPSNAATILASSTGTSSVLSTKVKVK